MECWSGTDVHGTNVKGKKGIMGKIASLSFLVASFLFSNIVLYVCIYLFKTQMVVYYLYSAICFLSHFL